MELDQLDKLPTFREAIKLPVEEYYKFANAVFGFRNNCMSPFLFGINKINEWCQAMNCKESLDQCRIPNHPLELLITKKQVVVTLKPLPTTTTSYMQMVHSVGHNGSCYDDYFCNPQSMAPYLHMVLGVLSLALCLVALLLTVVLLPALNVAANRTGATLYLTFVALCDIGYLLLFVLVVVIRYVPITYRDQLEMYARFTAFLVPHGLPTMQMMELISVWLAVALLVDRFLYLKLGFHSKIICSRSLSAKVIGVIVVLVVVYTVPKYLEYRLVEYSHIGMMKVIYTSVGYTESFQNLLLHWLKVPIEMFLPYLAVTIFGVLDSIKFYDLMYKRRLTEASEAAALTAAKRSSSTNSSIVHITIATAPPTANASNGGSNNNSSGGGLITSCVPDIDKASYKFPSIKIARDLPLLSSSLKSLEDRENLNVIVSLIIGFSLILFKVPKFVLHALKSESYVNEEYTKYFQPVTDFLDLMWVLVRPVVYLTIATHFRLAVCNIYCCCCPRDAGGCLGNCRCDDTADEQAGLVKCASVQMEMLAGDYVLQSSKTVVAANQSVVAAAATPTTDEDLGRLSMNAASAAEEKPLLPDSTNEEKA